MAINIPENIQTNDKVWQHNRTNQNVLAVRIQLENGVGKLRLLIPFFPAIYDEINDEASRGYRLCYDETMGFGERQMVKGMIVTIMEEIPENTFRTAP